MFRFVRPNRLYMSEALPWNQVSLFLKLDPLDLDEYLIYDGSN